MIPECFDYASFQAWKYEARTSKEVVSICDDCSDRYREKMHKEGKCEQVFWQKVQFNKKGTHADNCADKVKKGRQAQGEIAGNHKLTKSQAIDALSRHASGKSNASTARLFGVSDMCISRLVRRLTWKSIGG